MLLLGSLGSRLMHLPLKLLSKWAEVEMGVGVGLVVVAEEEEAMVDLEEEVARAGVEASKWVKKWAAPWVRQWAR